MTKSKMRKILKERWDGVSVCYISTHEGSVVLSGTRYIHTCLYTPNHDTIRRQHNKRVEKLQLFERWLKDLCQELNLPFTTYEKAHGRRMELIPENAP